jgi:hypothetical protein
MLPPPGQHRPALLPAPDLNTARDGAALDRPRDLFGAGDRHTKKTTPEVCESRTRRSPGVCCQQSRVRARTDRDEVVRLRRIADALPTGTPRQFYMVRGFFTRVGQRVATATAVLPCPPPIRLPSTARQRATSSLRA